MGSAPRLTAVRRRARVVCVAQLTNEMGRPEIDFEKGAADGATEALAIVARIADALLPP